MNDGDGMLKSDKMRRCLTVSVFCCVVVCLPFWAIESPRTLTSHPKENALHEPARPSSETLPDFLQFQINYVYRAGGKGNFQLLSSGSVLQSGDHYKVIFTPAQDCYIYIFQIDSRKQIYSLFPMEQFGKVLLNNLNPVKAGQTYYLPSEKKSFVLDANTGEEKIYVLASHQRDLELEELYQQAFEAQQRQQTIDEQLRQIDELLAEAMDVHGTATVASSDDDAAQVSWQEDGQTFSVLQQRLDQMCDGCVHVLTFTHQ